MESRGSTKYVGLFFFSDAGLCGENIVGRDAFSVIRLIFVARSNGF
jgi:hypothetical protein